MEAWWNNYPQYRRPSMYECNKGYFSLWKVNTEIIPIELVTSVYLPHILDTAVSARLHNVRVYKCINGSVYAQIKDS